MVNKKSFIVVNLIFFIANLNVLGVVLPHPDRIRTLDEHSKIAQGIAFSWKYIRYPVLFYERESYSSYMRWVEGRPEPDNIRMHIYPFIAHNLFSFFYIWQVHNNILKR
jgi:hypothetical protein